MELEGIRKDSIDIERVGKISIDNKDAFWVLTSRITDTTKFKNLMVYVKKSNIDENYSYQPDCKQFR
jgi:hypothetical protein